MMDCTVDILKHKGLRGLYQGYMSFILREIPFSSIQFPFYEILKITQIKLLSYKTSRPQSEVVLPSYVNALNGALAGSFAGFTVTPFDVLKTKLMTVSVNEATPRT